MLLGRTAGGLSGHRGSQDKARRVRGPPAVSTGGSPCLSATLWFPRPSLNTRSQDPPGLSPVIFVMFLGPLMTL